MPPTTLANLPKEQITAQLTAAYARAEPINNQMVDVSMEIQRLIAEIYRRAIIKNAGLEPVRVKCVMSIGANVHPNKGIPELVRRLEEFASAGLKIVRVEFNETLNEYRFYADPETPTSNEPNEQTPAS